MGLVVDVDWEHRIRARGLHEPWDIYLWNEVMPRMPADARCGCHPDVKRERSACRPFLKQIKILDEGGKRINVRYHPRAADGSLELDCGYNQLKVKFATIELSEPFPVEFLDQDCGGTFKVVFA